MSVSIEQAPKLANPADVGNLDVLVGFDDAPAAPCGRADDLVSSAVPCNSLTIDALLGPPEIGAGEDLAAFRRLENSAAASMIDPGRPITYMDVRSWSLAFWAALRQRRCLTQKLNVALAGQIALVAPDGGSAGDVVAALMAGRAVDKSKIEKILAKAKVSYDSCLTQAMSEIAADYETLSRLIDSAESKAQAIERHCSRREAERYRLALLRRKAFDAQALGPFE